MLFIFSGELILVNNPSQKVKVSATSQNAVPFIIQTNEKQWAKAQKNLMSYCLFGEVKASKSNPVPFERFFNFFLPFFIESTRQINPKDFVVKFLSKEEIMMPESSFSPLLKRPLYDSEISFFRQEKLSNKSHVSFNDLNGFWNW